MAEESCSNCGAVYEVTTHKIAMRDKDSFDCEDCGQELKRWSGGVIFSFRKVTAGKPKDA
jgi:predicted Zn finger-like uncharacterized protein